MTQPSPELVGLQDWPQDPIPPFHPPSAGPVWTGLDFGLSTTGPYDNLDLEALSPMNMTPDRKASIASTSISNYSRSPETPSGFPDIIQSTLYVQSSQIPADSQRYVCWRSGRLKATSCTGTRYILQFQSFTTGAICPGVPEQTSLSQRNVYNIACGWFQHPQPLNMTTRSRIVFIAVPYKSCKELTPVRIQLRQPTGLKISSKSRHWCCSHCTS